MRKGLFTGMLLLLLAFTIPNPAWAPWVHIGGYGLKAEQIRNIDDKNGDLASLCVDSNGFPHIVWTQENEIGWPSIYYLKWNGTDWVDADGSGQESICIPDSGPVSSSINVCLDSKGYPHITWDSRIGSGSFISYLWWNGSEWVDADGAGRESIKVGTGYDYGHPSLCLDPNDNPHLLVVKEYPSYLHLCYIRWDGSRWIGTGNIPGQKEGGICDISKSPESLLLCLDSNNQPHIVLALEEKDHSEIYYRYWNTDRKLWCEGLRKYGDNKSYLMPSLCLDSKNRPHIAFCSKTESSQFSPGDIHYLRWNGSEWVDADGVGKESENITNNKDDCIAPSLCLDSKDYSHIAWFNKDKGEIHSLKWNGSRWIDPDASAWPEVIRLLRDKWNTKQRWSLEFYTQIRDAVEAQEPMSRIREATESFFLCLDLKDRPHIAWISDFYEKPICYAKWVSAELYRDEYTHLIEGYVMDKRGNPVSGVTVKLSSNFCYGTYITSNNGYYEFIYLPLGGNYTVTPRKFGFRFSPEKYEYSMLGSNKDNQNFEKRSLLE